MADVSAEIAAFRDAAYGEDVRGALIQLATKLATECSTYTNIVTGYNNRLIKAEDVIKYSLFDIIYEDETSHSIPANASSNTTWFTDYIELDAGRYYVLCYQEGNAGSGTSRDCLLCFDGTSYCYGQDPQIIKEGIKVDYIDIPTNGNWRFGIWIRDNTNAISVRNFILAKDILLFDKLIDESINREFYTTDIFYYGQNYPIIKLNNDNSYTITLPNTRTARKIIIDNVKRGRALSVVMSQPGEELTLNHDGHLIYDFSDNLFKVVYDTFKIKNTVKLLYNSSGNLIGPWSKYRLFGLLSTINRPYIGPYGGFKPSFTINNDGSIDFYCERMTCWYNTINNYNTVKNYVVGMSQSINIPVLQYCIYNVDTQTIQTISEDSLKSNTMNNYIIMFYNNYGRVRGDWEIYYLLDRKISSNVDLYFYGKKSIPRFSIDSDNTITVTIPSIARYNYIIKSNVDTWRQYCGNTSFINYNTTYVVPHDKALVFNRTTNALYIRDDAFEYSSDEELLFYNSAGSVNGPWRMYYIEDKLKNVSDNMISIPTYYSSHIETKSKSINLLTTAQSKDKIDSFVFITDIHYPSNSLNSPVLIKAICYNTGINKIQLNGDYINRENDKETALYQINKTINKYQYSNIKTYVTVGNHEYNNPAASSDPVYLAAELSETELRWPLYNLMNENVTYDNNSLAYYYDNTVAKIRYFVGEVGKGTGIVLNSVEWIGKQIENVPDGYGIVLIFHTILDRVNDQPIVQRTNQGALLQSILDAAKTKTTHTYNNITYNYTNKNFDVICALCGDWHIDMDYTTPQGVHIIATTTDSFQQEGDLVRTSGTISEQAFDVVTINRDSRKINLTRIGAGEDREFTY